MGVDPCLPVLPPNPYRSAGPWLPVLPPDPYRSAGPWLPVLPPEPSRSAGPWLPVLPHEPSRSAGPWLPVLPHEPLQWGVCVCVADRLLAQFGDDPQGPLPHSVCVFVCVCVCVCVCCRQAPRLVSGWSPGSGSPLCVCVCVADRPGLRQPLHESLPGVPALQTPPQHRAPL